MNSPIPWIHPLVNSSCEIDERGYWNKTHKWTNLERGTSNQYRSNCLQFLSNWGCWRSLVGCRDFPAWRLGVCKPTFLSDTVLRLRLLEYLCLKLVLNWATSETEVRARCRRVGSMLLRLSMLRVIEISCFSVKRWNESVGWIVRWRLEERPRVFHHSSQHDDRYSELGTRQIS